MTLQRYDGTGYTSRIAVILGEVADDTMYEIVQVVILVCRRGNVEMV
jgi:hypothetical protein